MWKFWLPKAAMVGAGAFIGIATGGVGIAIAGTAIGISGVAWGSAAGGLVALLDTTLDLFHEKIKRELAEMRK